MPCQHNWHVGPPVRCLLKLDAASSVGRLQQERRCWEAGGDEGVRRDAVGDGEARKESTIDSEWRGEEASGDGKGCGEAAGEGAGRPPAI
jgi:hypothetical protein